MSPRSRSSFRPTTAPCSPTVKLAAKAVLLLIAFLSLSSLWSSSPSPSPSLPSLQANSLRLQESAPAAPASLPGLLRCPELPKPLPAVAWDRHTVYTSPSDPDQKCLWSEFYAHDPANSVPICLHAKEHGYVSGMVKNEGSWAECRELPGLYELYRQKGGDGDTGSKPQLYVDIGSNIGTCVLQVRARE